jgi:predicted 3-demethylubiquinone-9 3-methyltransferase (glyoxalase superfamily)
MQKITTHLWFDTQAREAGEFYTSTFGGSRVKSVTTLHDTPSGDVDVVVIDIAGHEFTLISAGPLFKFNPSISFLVSCATKEEVDALWGALSDGGTARMELGAYPFSERYGWVQDRYGLSWQVMFAGGRPIAQKITPVLMFTGKQAGNTEAAIRFYASVFHDSKVGDMMRYGAGEEPDAEGSVKFARFKLEGQQFAAMDSAREHGFAFNEAISLMVNCENQEEIDYYWERLSADPRSEQCGWLKDKYGVSWQVVPTEMNEMMAHGTPQQIARVTEEFLKMKKFDVAKLREAYEAA